MGGCKECKLQLTSASPTSPNPELHTPQPPRTLNANLGFLLFTGFIGSIEFTGLTGHIGFPGFIGLYIGFIGYIGLIEFTGLRVWGDEKALGELREKVRAVHSGAPCLQGLENGKEHGNYYKGYIGVILGLYWENGKENGNYYKRIRVAKLV